MKIGAIKSWMIVSVVLCWILIIINIYALTQDNVLDNGNNSLVGRVIEQGGEVAQQDNRSIVEQLFSDKAPERPSPCNRVKESQIFVTNDRIVIDFQNAEWATFTDTNSMDPIIDAEANALEYAPKSPEEICVGDIASYHTKLSEGVVIHRIVEIGFDEKGWYATFKGDNLAYKDPERVRFEQIERVVIGIIY